MSNFKLVSLTTRPEPQQIEPLLNAYYGLLIARMREKGRMVNDAADGAIREFWTNITEYLPPKGRLYIAYDTENKPVGCGTLKSLPNGKGELKRLYVAPKMRGSGLGRALVARRLEDARDMGLSEVLIDTLDVSHEMHALYSKMGFDEIGPYTESTTLQTAPELEKHMKFFRMRL